MDGFGRFRMSERTLLSSHTAPTKRFWNVPDWLNPAKGGCIPSYHNETNYIDALLKTAGRGQEFVCQPTQNDKFQDKYFSGIDIDLSKVLFVLSYNDVEQIDKILLDRIHRIKFSHLSIDEKIHIAKVYTLPEIYKTV